MQQPPKLLLGAPTFALDPMDTKDLSKPPASLVQQYSVPTTPAPDAKYTTTPTTGIRCWRGEKAQSLPAMDICTGGYKVPASTLQGKILNLAEFLFPLNKSEPDLWKYTNASNLSERIMAFVMDPKYPKRWATLMEAPYYIPAIDRTKPPKAKRDLPNVNAILVALLLTYKPFGDVEFVNPLSNAAANADVWNLSELARRVRSDLKPEAATPLVLTQENKQSGWCFVNFTRGNGVPSNADTEAINLALKTHYGASVDSTICHTQLTPGKYSSDGVSQLCYQGFEKDIAVTIQSFLTIPVHMKLSEKPRVAQVLLAMDEFSAYAMALAAGAVGFGVHKHTSILAYNKGVYTPMALYPWNPKANEAGKTYAALAFPASASAAAAPKSAGGASAGATAAAAFGNDAMKA